MAQQPAGPYLHTPDYSIVPFAAGQYSAPIPHPTLIPIQTRSSGVGEELFHTNPGNKSAIKASVDQPNKRVKVGPEGSDHKFVSQNKWKFSSAQPWLPSKLSSKAQNASGSIHRAKIESADSKLSSSVVATSSHNAPVPSTSGTRKPQDAGRASKKEMLEVLPQYTRTGRPSVQAGDNAVASASPLLQSSLVTQVIAPTHSATGNTDVYSKFVEENDQRTHESRISDTMSTRLVQHSSGKSKSNSGNGTLSLEKDAKRIAALIAEKRKENESSMFRERLLQRQRQHKDQTDEKEIQRTSRAPSTNNSDCPSEPQTETRLAHEATTKGVHKSSVEPDAPRLYSHLRGNQSAQAGRQQYPAMSNTDVEPLLTAWKATPVAKKAVRTATSISTSPIPQVVHHRSSIFSNEQTSSTQRTNSKRVQLQAAVNSLPVVSPGNSSFKVEGTQTKPQLNTFRGQMVAKDRSSEVQAHTQTDFGQFQQRYHNRHTMSPPSTTQARIPKQNTSTPSTSVPNSIEILTNSAPSPASVSSAQSPTAASMQQFANMDLSAHASHNSTHASSSAYNRPATMDHLASSAVNSQMWASPEQHIHHRHTSQISHNISRTAMYPHNNTVASVQHWAAPVPLLASSAKALNSDVRPGKTSRKGLGASKQRVNMFSNTRGTPFPMHEVIKQIEMT